MRTRCCPGMIQAIESGVDLGDINSAADRIVGEETPEMRYCPWCGWDTNKVIGARAHFKRREELINAAEIGAVIDN